MVKQLLEAYSKATQVSCDSGLVSSMPFERVSHELIIVLEIWLSNKLDDIKRKGIKKVVRQTYRCFFLKTRPQFGFATQRLLYTICQCQIQHAPYELHKLISKFFIFFLSRLVF